MQCVPPHRHHVILRYLQYYHYLGAPWSQGPGRAVLVRKASTRNRWPNTKWLSTSSLLKNNLQKPKIIPPEQPFLVDRRFDITVKNLQPFQSFTMRAELKSEKNEVYESFGHFVADSTGSANSNIDPSFGGSYTGIDCMGLFWSMVPAPGQRKGLRFTPKNVSEPLRYEIQLFDGHVTLTENKRWKETHTIASSTILRTYLAPNVERIEVNVGRIRGTLFLPKQEGKFPGVIDMFGSHGGLLEHRAALLASNGFVAFALAFFEYKDLPKRLHDVELEYFIEAVEWLSKHERVYSNGIGYVGVSYGGQIALQVAAECSMVKAVVAISSPTSILNQVRYRNELIGLAIPEEGPLEINDGVISSKLYYKYLEDALLEGEIESEKIVGQVMIITGEDDESITAVKFANSLKKRILKKANKQVIHLSYPKTGHLIEPPYMHLCSVSFHKFFNHLWAWGGHSIQHNAAQEHSWKSIISFLKSNLTEKQSSKL